MLHDGNKIIVEDPTSSIVIEKSVPLTPIVAVGVDIDTLVGLNFAICPDAYLTVPNVAFNDSFPVLVLGSYTKSSIVNLLCCVTSTLVASKNSIAVLPLPVLTVSNENTSSSVCVVTSSPFALRSITPDPSCMITSPIEFACKRLGINRKNITKMLFIAIFN